MILNQKHFFHGSYDEKVACKKILEKWGLKGFQVILGFFVLFAVAL